MLKKLSHIPLIFALTLTLSDISWACLPDEEDLEAGKPSINHRDSKGKEREDRVLGANSDNRDTSQPTSASRAPGENKDKRENKRGEQAKQLNSRLNFKEAIERHEIEIASNKSLGNYEQGEGESSDSDPAAEGAYFSSWGAGVNEVSEDEDIDIETRHREVTAQNLADLVGYRTLANLYDEFSLNESQRQRFNYVLENIIISVKGSTKRKDKTELERILEEKLREIIPIASSSEVQYRIVLKNPKSTLAEKEDEFFERENYYLRHKGFFEALGVVSAFEAFLAGISLYPFIKFNIPAFDMGSEEGQITATLVIAGLYTPFMASHVYKINCNIINGIREFLKNPRQSKVFPALTKLVTIGGISLSATLLTLYYMLDVQNIYGNSENETSVDTRTKIETVVSAICLWKFLISNYSTSNIRLINRIRHEGLFSFSQLGMRETLMNRVNQVMRWIRSANTNLRADRSNPFVDQFAEILGARINPSAHSAEGYTGVSADEEEDIEKGEMKNMIVMSALTPSPSHQNARTLYSSGESSENLAERALLNLAVSRDQARQESRAKTWLIRNMNDFLRSTTVEDLFGYTGVVIASSSVFANYALTKHLITVISETFNLSSSEPVIITSSGFIAFCLTTAQFENSRNWFRRLPSIISDCFNCKQGIPHCIGNIAKHTVTGIVTGLPAVIFPLMSYGIAEYSFDDLNDEYKYMLLVPQLFTMYIFFDMIFNESLANLKQTIKYYFGGKTGFILYYINQMLNFLQDELFPQQIEELYEETQNP